MKCSCGNSIKFTLASANRRCNLCGGALQYDTDDFLLYGANDLVREVRPGQVQMGRIVEEAMRKEQIALVEGPVGIGKSFAYAIPAVQAGKRVVISTAKKQLQHQLARKDVPYLAQKLEREVPIGLIKGKSNYACRVKVPDIPKEEQQPFYSWLDSSEYGDLSDLPGKRPFFWPDVTAEDCIGQRCRFADRCGYWKAKQQVRAAQVVIANHHMVAFDLKFGPHKLLGPYDALIIDEAHQAEEAMRGAYGQTVHQFGYRRMQKLMYNAGLGSALDKPLEEAWKSMFDGIRHLSGEVPKNPFGDAGDETLRILGAIRDDVKKDMAEAGVDPEDDFDEDETPETTKKRVDWAAVARLEMLKKTLDRSWEGLETAREPDQNTVVYITDTAKGNKVVNVAPISVGALIGPKLYQLKTTVITSATMAVNGSFDDIKRRLGLDRPPSTPQAAPAGPISPGAATPEPKQVIEAVLQSPFDYSGQAVLYVPKHLPLPPAWGNDAAKASYYDAYAAEIEKLVRASDGNAFVLFTANSDLQAIHARLVTSDLENPILVQGDDAEAALKQYMATPKSVLLGSKSFWEGVDVVGNKLRLVVVFKLPFPQMTDPVLQAKQRLMTQQAKARGMPDGQITGMVFSQLQVPKMITDLRQGAGRLIRSKADKGVLAILDPRVWTGSSKRAPTASQSRWEGYGATVVNSLGYSNKISDFNLVQRFLKLLASRPD